MSDTTRMNELLQQVHAVLKELNRSGDDTVDDEVATTLRLVQAEVDRLIGPSAAAADEARSVANSLREALVDFEVEHPQLTSLLGRLGDALANLGI